MESPRPRRERKAVEKGILFAAFLAALDASPAQALEVDPSSSWQGGIEQSVRASVQRDTVERAATYVRFKDGTGMWLHSTSGQAQATTINFAELRKAALSSGKPTKAICVLHTHPTEINRAHIRVSGVAPESVPIPPSRADIANAQALKASTGDKYVFGSADSFGVWYFSAKRPDGHFPQSAVNEQKFYEIYKHFVLKSTRAGFNFSAELPALQQAYGTYLQGEVRFVSYGDIGNEPPCAGVDYTPDRPAKNAPETRGARATSQSPVEQGRVTIDLSTAPKSFRPPQ